MTGAGWGTGQKPLALWMPSACLKKPKKDHNGSASKFTFFCFLGPKMSKLAFGSVKNESGAWDLPQDASIYRWPHLFIDGRIYK